MKRTGLGILAFLISIAVFVSPALALEDMNGDYVVNVLDLVLSQNPKIVSGDTNADSKVDIFDLATVGLAYGSQPGDANWNPDADVANTVDKIDIFDLATVGLNFNKQFPEPVIDPIFSVSPASSDLKVGENVTIDITIETIPADAEIYAAELKIYFDPAVLRAESVTEGDFLKQDGAFTSMKMCEAGWPDVCPKIDNILGKIEFMNTRMGADIGGISGTGTLITLIFSGKAAGSSYLNIDDILVSDPNLEPVTEITANNGSANVACNSHQYFACFDDDVYWYDSCDNREEKKEDCGENSCDAFGANYCKEGDVYHQRTCYDKGCSEGSCFSNPFEDEEMVEECPYGCENGACITQCTQNSDCGTDGFVGDPTCSADDVYQDYRTYTCNNPGTKDSYCSHTDTLTLKEDCGEDYCEAWGSNYCKNDDVYRKRTCHKQGCATGSCFDTPSTEEELVKTCEYGCSDSECIVPSCTQDSDCGTDGLTGGLFCSANDVYQDYRTYTCNNPGTAYSYCSHTDTPQLQEDCGGDYCDAFGANYCKQGNLYRKRTCYDLGCSGGACFNNPFEDEKLVEECPYGCEDNACVIPVCIKDSDCGTDGWVCDTTCSNDDVYQDYRTYTCNNPGTKDSYCSYTDTLTLKEDCGEDYCDAFGSNYCKDGNVYHNRNCYDKGCAEGECYSTIWDDVQLVEECLYGCQDGECLLTATVNLHEGVNLFSLPLIPVNGTVAFNKLSSNCTVLVNGINSSCTGPNLAYLNPDTGDYICLGLDDPLYPGDGYFIKVANACSFKIIGADLPSSQIGYKGSGVIKEGENLIGAPTSHVSFASIKNGCKIYDPDPLMFVYGATTCAGIGNGKSGDDYCEEYLGDLVYNYCYCSVSKLWPGFGYNIYSFNECSFI